MVLKDWNWGAVAAVGTIVASFIASVAYLESGLGRRIEAVETRLNASIVAVETRLNASIVAVETRLGDRIDKVEVSIAAMRTELQVYEHNHNERQLAIENRLTALEVAQR